jgi:hypothetical protein
VSTYRVGNHWGVTIVREATGSIAHGEGAALVAVVVTSDVTFAHGAREALAEMRRQMGAGDDGTVFPGFEKMLRDAAGELGVTE